MPNGENPYQPPAMDAADVQVAPSSFGWETDGATLKVALTARLPMIDPFTGGTAETMMLQKIPVPYRPKWLWAFPLLGALGGLAADITGLSGTFGPIALFGAIAGWLLSKLIANQLEICTLRFFLEKETRRRRVGINRILILLLLATVASAAMNAVLPNQWFGWLPPTLFWSWLLGCLAAILFQRRFLCRRRDGGKFIITGMHPLALQALAAEQERSVRKPPADIPKT